MHFYDAKLLRLRARTHTDPEARRADITAALARRQGAPCSNCAPRSTTSNSADNQPAPPSSTPTRRIPTNNAWPELARATGQPL